MTKHPSPAERAEAILVNTPTLVALRVMAALSEGETLPRGGVAALERFYSHLVAVRRPPSLVRTEDFDAASPSRTALYAARDAHPLRADGAARARPAAPAARDKLGSAGRAEAPFRVLWEDAAGIRHAALAQAVLDASGTWDSPNPIGIDGLPVPGEAEKSGADRLRHPGRAQARARALCRRPYPGDRRRPLGDQRRPRPPAAPGDRPGDADRLGAPARAD